MIRKAQKSDVPGILKIENDLFPDPWDEQLFIDLLDKENKYFFVKELNGDLAGYVVFERIVDEGHITNLGVAKPYQKKGIATQLIGNIIDLAKGMKIGIIFLEVRQGNEAAKRLYSRFGFKEIGKRKAYYPKANEDALILALEI